MRNLRPLENLIPLDEIVAPQAFDISTERARFVTAVSEGLADAEAGRLHDHTDVVARMKARYDRGSK